MSRKRIPLNQNGCTADFRMSVPFEQNLQTATSLAAFTDNAGFLTVIVAFKLVALPFLGVTLTQSQNRDSLLKYYKMEIFLSKIDVKELDK